MIQSNNYGLKRNLCIDKPYRKIKEGEIGERGREMIVGGLNNNQAKRNRILVVDDEPDVCALYQVVLEDAGYKCISYNDSVKAMQEFVPNYYDLILLDIKMPVLNGFEFCEKIREADKSIGIVFLTASEQFYKKVGEEKYPELINYSDNIRYVQKPIENEELIKIVNMISETRDGN